MTYTYDNLYKHIEKDGIYLLDKIKKDNKKIISKDSINDILSKFFGYEDFNHLKKTYSDKENKNILYITQKELNELSFNYKEYIEKYIHDGKFKNGYGSHFIFLDHVITLCKKSFNSNLLNILKIDLTNYDYRINLNEEQFKEYCFLFCEIKNTYNHELNLYENTKTEFKLIFKYLNLLNKPISKESIYKNITLQSIKNNLNNKNKDISLISKEIFDYFDLKNNNKESFFYKLMRINHILSHPYFFGNIYSDNEPEIIELSELKNHNVELFFHDKEINIELFQNLLK